MLSIHYHNWTACLGCLPRGLVCPGGCLPRGNMSAQRGVGPGGGVSQYALRWGCLPRECVCRGGCLPGGVWLGGVCPGGVCFGVCLPEGCIPAFTEADTPLWTVRIRQKLSRTYKNDERRDEFPAELPPPAGFSSEHRPDVCGERWDRVDPGHSYTGQEPNHQQRTNMTHRYPSTPPSRFHPVTKQQQKSSSSSSSSSSAAAAAAAVLSTWRWWIFTNMTVNWQRITTF